MAVHPACITKHSPLPRGFVPKPGREKAKALPYPNNGTLPTPALCWVRAIMSAIEELARHHIADRFRVAYKQNAA